MTQLKTVYKNQTTTTAFIRGFKQLLTNASLSSLSDLVQLNTGQASTFDDTYAVAVHTAEPTTSPTSLGNAYYLQELYYYYYYLDAVLD